MKILQALIVIGVSLGFLLDGILAAPGMKGGTEAMIGGVIGAFGVFLLMKAGER